jgi:hypothetical protein
MLIRLCTFWLSVKRIAYDLFLDTGYVDCSWGQIPEED